MSVHTRGYTRIRQNLWTANYGPRESWDRSSSIVAIDGEKERKKERERERDRKLAGFNRKIDFARSNVDRSLSGHFIEVSNREKSDEDVTSSPAFVMSERGNAGNHSGSKLFVKKKKRSIDFNNETFAKYS